MRMLLVIITILVVGAFGLASFATHPAAEGASDQPIRQQWQAGFILKTIKVGEKSLQYAVYVPREYSPDKAMPAIVFLHGSGESGTDGQKMIAQGIGTNILWNAQRWPCIVMMPQKPVEKQQWEAYDAEVMAMLEQTKREYAIDADRIALTGLSQGGHGTWSFGVAHPEIWCALAPICGYADAHGGGLAPEAIAAKIKGIPVWCFHGADDNVVPPEQSRAVIEALKKAGGTGPESGGPRLTIYPKTNHGSWDKAYAEQDLPAFLMTPRKK